MSLSCGFKELLEKHCTRERSVAFYADKLYITPQYLSSLLKDISGKNATKWIGDYVISEAKTFLQQPNTNISEVANSLNFSDISAFGKFFKRHTGISPGAYQKMYAFN